MLDKTLIQKTVYFYKSDIPKWEAMEKKTQFIHNALNPNQAVVTGPYTLGEFKAAEAAGVAEREHLGSPKKTEPHINFLDKRARKK